MGYSDQKFYTRRQIPAGFGVALGTATAAGTASNTLTDIVATLPKFERRSKVLAIRLRNTVAVDADSTLQILQFANGTDVFATVNVTDGTADQFFDATMVETNGIDTFAADGKPTVNLTGTATASAAVLGTFDIWFEVQELPL